MTQFLDDGWSLHHHRRLWMVMNTTWWDRSWTVGSFGDSSTSWSNGKDTATRRTLGYLRVMYQLQERYESSTGSTLGPHSESRVQPSNPSTSRMPVLQGNGTLRGGWCQGTTVWITDLCLITGQSRIISGVISGVISMVISLIISVWFSIQSLI